MLSGGLHRALAKPLPPCRGRERSTHLAQQHHTCLDMFKRLHAYHEIHIRSMCNVLLSLASCCFTVLRKRSERCSVCSMGNMALENVTKKVHNSKPVPDESIAGTSNGLPAAIEGKGSIAEV